jgi:hypothetical protein
MIAGLSETERPWLERFFGAPNELTWADIETGAAPTDRLDAILPWLSRLQDGASDTPIILPFYSSGAVAGWYATASTKKGEQRLRATLQAWFGPSYLSHLQAADPANSSAEAMRSRFGKRVLAFKGPDGSKIGERLALMAKLDAQRPVLGRSEPRPVGRVRSDLERALLSRDEASALALIAELRGSGRLNEENLRFLDIRLMAGLGQWELIARDYWTIKNLADLPLPPQTLSDLIDALYRTYVDDAEVDGDAQAVRVAFEERVAKPFPKLFASRQGVRTRRVVKAFVLYENLQTRPDPTILEGLIGLLPAADAGWADAFVGPPNTLESVVVERALDEPGAQQPDYAEAAFEDGQYDRAYELYLAKPLHRKSLSVLLSCVQFIGTAEARRRLLNEFDAQPSVHADLPSALVLRLQSLRDPSAESEAERPLEAAGWMRWARRLAAGYPLETVEAEVLDDRATWEAVSLRSNAQLCREFSDLIGNLTGGAADVARRALPLIVAAFFPESEPIGRSTKPLATVVLLLIAMDEAVAREDLEVLSTVLAALLELGLGTQDYLTTVADLEAIQDRVASFANLAWSLDVCEALAISSVPSSEADEARLRFFLKVVSQSRGFSHRLDAHDFLPIEYLARDYGVEPYDIADLRPALKPVDHAETGEMLAGKTIGIYTLTEAAGVRAKSALRELFPYCTVEVNSDTVCTSSLTNLARTADIFVFAWRSSSHQAFFCVKDALGGRDPIYAAGKGTASLVNAVRGAIR